MRFFVMIFKFAASLKVAVFLLLSLAATLAAATFIESSYTTAVAQKMVYRTTWFSILLLLLGLNIAAAAIIRFPWRKRHIAFLTTHAGLLILLTGSLQTQIQGFEARLILREGEKGSVLATDKKELKILAKDQGFQQSRTIPFFVRPREGKDLVHFAVGERFSAAVDSYLPWAGSEINLVKNPTGKPVLLLDLKGQMGTVQEWLSLEESSKDELNLGPAVISLTTIPDDSSLKSFFTEKIKVNAERKGELIINIKGKVNKIPLPQKFPKELQLGDGTKIQFVRYMPHAIVENNKLVNKSDQPINPAIELVIHIQKFEPEFHTAFSKFPDFPTLHGHKESAAGVSVKFIDPDMTEAARNELAFGVTSDGKLHYRVVHRGNQTKRGVAEVGSQTELGWMGMTFTVKKFEPKGERENLFYPVNPHSTEDPLPSAIRVRLRNGGDTKTVWLSEETRVFTTVGGSPVELTYASKTTQLPFAITLRDFDVGFDPGTNSAASYSSVVTLHDGEKTFDQKIWMNHPLVYGGYKFFQSSYAMENGEPKISIFQVARDPGRTLKYAGSILICLGIILLFWFNPWRQGQSVSMRLPASPRPQPEKKTVRRPEPQRRREDEVQL